MENWQKKTLSRNEREMKRIADAAEPPIVVPVTLVAVAVHVALVVPPIEGDVTNTRSAFCATVL